MAHAPKLPPVLRVRLDPQTGRQHKLPHRRPEAGQEGVERLRNHPPLVSFLSSIFPFNPVLRGRRVGGAKTHIIPHNHAVHKLQPAQQNQIGHEEVGQFDALRSCGQVGGPEGGEDFEGGLVVAAAAG